MSNEDAIQLQTEIDKIKVSAESIYHTQCFLHIYLGVSFG